jgi:hypothetical protein
MTEVSLGWRVAHNSDAPKPLQGFFAAAFKPCDKPAPKPAHLQPLRTKRLAVYVRVP